ncbi:GGDEF domain-containing protein [Paludibacterium paludis]|uniref:diguanylate cyclase n=1 Tax=Paludibacterium paludis TaxID=1225769 RepID=A0A918P5N2_9NEIS|nr:GGDEF domain-containing protein [Paludibacterium paludis]GGY21909.1 hypothetical protein GCM10011289_27080 [Paludibacterium paludis]
MTTSNPIEVARETLKQLSVRKLLPTPENFERVYHELTGTPVERENKLATQLYRAIESLQAQSVAARVTLSRLKQVIEESRWEQVPQLVIDYVQDAARDMALAQSWGALIQNLLRAWDLRNPEVPQHFKQSTLDRVLINYGNSPEELNQKLVGLIQNWTSGQGDAPGVQTNADAESAGEASLVELGEISDGASWNTWQRALAFALKHGLEPRLVSFPELVDMLETLIRDLDTVSDATTLESFMARLRSFMIRLELQAQQEGRLVTSLTQLIRLMLENIAQLNRDDSYLVGQVSSLQEVLAHEPLSMQQVYLLETNLKEVIRKQGTLKTSLDEATNSLKALLDSFIARLGSMTDSTSEFYSRISAHNVRLQETQDVEHLTRIVGELLDDTANMQTGLRESHDELVSARNQVEAAEERIRELESALEAASAKVKEDQLTGAYNRHGLAEFFEREISRTERSGTPLSVALIDVDNFKQLNDRYGHLAGDDALKYLVDVIRHNLRPADIVARFGGEEFVLLMPDTAPAEAMQTIQRLQRELTRTFFLANDDRLVITFSAGVAQWHRGETDMEVIERADRAMYQAKLAGKNRVFSAEDDAQEP